MIRKRPRPGADFTLLGDQQRCLLLVVSRDKNPDGSGEAHAAKAFHGFKSAVRIESLTGDTHPSYQKRHVHVQSYVPPRAELTYGFTEPPAFSTFEGPKRLREAEHLADYIPTERPRKTLRTSLADLSRRQTCD